MAPAGTGFRLILGLSALLMVDSKLLLEGISALVLGARCSSPGVSMWM